MSISIEHAGFQKTHQSEKVCGDAIRFFDREQQLVVAVVDGLGHGPKAHEASEAFCAAVASHIEHLSIEELLLHAHAEIRSTRGVAAALVSIDKQAHSLEFTGVGNIELSAHSALPIKPVSVPGVVGQRIRKTKTFTYQLSDGDLISLYSDGVSNRFELKKFAHLPVQKIAEAIVAVHGKDHDDATCVILHCTADE